MITLVFGRRLEGGAPSRDYQWHLRRALSLAQQQQVDHVLLLAPSALAELSPVALLSSSYHLARCLLLESGYVMWIALGAAGRPSAAARAAALSRCGAMSRRPRAGSC